MARAKDADAARVLQDDKLYKWSRLPLVKGYLEGIEAAVYAASRSGESSTDLSGLRPGWEDLTATPAARATAWSRAMSIIESRERDFSLAGDLATDEVIVSW